VSEGTGKIIVCKALMAEAEEITCITTNAYSLDADEYVTELYGIIEEERQIIETSLYK